MFDRIRATGLGIVKALAEIARYGEPEEGGRWWIAWQNLSHAESKGDLPIEGRASLYFSSDASEKLRVAWNLWTTFAHVGVSADPSEGDIGFKIALPPVALWISLESFSIFRRIFGRAERLEPSATSLSFHDGTIWWNVAADPGAWSSDTPRWRQGSFDVARAIFGESTAATTPVGGPVPVKVPMPEGVYEGTCSMEIVRVGRPRWFSSTYRRAEIELATPIPIPGKGENAWDCDDDAISAHGGPASSPADAVANLVRSSLRARERRAGRDWTPSAPAPIASAEA